MNSTSLRQQFAMNKAGVMVAIADVARGLGCDCFCPACTAPLIARQGKVRLWHFAHASDHGCAMGAETALHKAAKEILRREMALAVPAITATETVTLKDGRSGTATAGQASMRLVFNQVLIEPTLATLRPDIIASIGNQQFLIEIAVSHFVDDEKQRKIQAIGWPAIEVTLDRTLYKAWDWAKLRQHIIEEIAFKTWLTHPALPSLRQDAKVRASLIAHRQPRPLDIKSPIRRSYRYGGATLYSYEWPESIVVWQLGAMQAKHFLLFSKIMRSLGGSWQQSRDNWRLPKHAGSQLDSLLRKGG